MGIERAESSVSGGRVRREVNSHRWGGQGGGLADKMSIVQTSGRVSDGAFTAAGFGAHCDDAIESVIRDN